MSLSDEENLLLGQLLSELTRWISPGAVLIEEEAEVPSFPTVDHSSEVLL